MNDTTPVPPDIDGSKPSKSQGFLGRLSKRSNQQQGKDSAAVNADDKNVSAITPNTNNNDATTTDKHDLKIGQDSGSISTGSAKLGSQDEKQGSFIDGVGSAEQRKSTSNTQKGDANADNNQPDGGDDANGAGDGAGGKKKRGVIEEVRRTFWMVITYSWINVLLVFVPVGIVVANIQGVHPGLVFGMNCIAVIPLAGLLSHATESVASKLGDALGALLNVTFGNAVELIIFIIALSKGQIRIVQASLLGSILANLLLILGMGFFLGGLRYREQVYNSTVTQMSACLLSLSVISLVLPVSFQSVNLTVAIQIANCITRLPSTLRSTMLLQQTESH